MVPKDRLTKGQAKKLYSLSKEYPKTGQACHIAAAFDGFCKCAATEEAGFAFGRLCPWMRRCRLEPMKEAAATLLRHKENILAYFRSSLCQRHLLSDQLHDTGGHERKVRGFNTFKGFASMIYLIAGKLELSVPHPFKGT